MTSNDIDTNSEQQLWKQVLRLVHHCQVDELEQLDSCLEQASWLLTHVDTQGDTLLHHATRANHLHVIDWCLQHGAPVNIANRRGRQPLHEAVGHLDSMRHLLDNNASVDGMKRGDWTPLHLTALKGDLPGLKLLLEHGADPHLTIRDGRTVLHLAATTDESMSLHLVRVVPSLITCASSNGRLPVHMAAQAGYQQALDAMLAVAPDTLEYRDHAGTTPWLAAVIGGHTELVTHLTATTNRSIQHTTDSNAGYLGLLDTFTLRGQGE
ncbi:ankyrin repeat-containing domain protein [Syncephalis plumigaleata]|nr:ankyrin repeat-containing domain protein [Syncephalis plumigaleata]